MRAALRLPRLRLLAAGRFASGVGDWLAAATLIGWVYVQTRSTLEVALLLLLRIAPNMLGGGLAAALVDRLPRGRVLVAAETGRTAVLACALVCVWLGAGASIFAAVAVAGMFGIVSSTAASSLVPALGEEELLPGANAALGVAGELAMAAGALGAGMLLAVAGVRAALAAAVLAFAASAATSWRLRSVEAGSGAARTRGGLAGVGVLVRNRALVACVGSFAAATVATGLANATLPRFLGGLGLGAAGYGFGLAALAGGLALGQVLGGRVPLAAIGPRRLGIPLLAMAALFVALSQSPTAAAALVSLAAIGVFDGANDVVFTTVVQREAGPEYVGRAFGFASVAFRTTMLGAVALAPLVNRLGSPRSTILVAALPLVAACALATLGSERSHRVMRPRYRKKLGTSTSSSRPTATGVA
jgi:MFS family permease